MTASQTARAREPKLATLARRTVPWGFPVLYLGWAYLFWSPLLGSETSVWTGRKLVLFLVGGASPMLAGMGLAWLTGGAERLRDLGRRLVDVGRVGWRWWLVVLLFWPILDLVMAGAAMLLGVTARPIHLDWDALTDPAMLMLNLALWLVFPAVAAGIISGWRRTTTRITWAGRRVGSH